MSSCTDLAEQGRAITLHRHLPDDLPAAAARYVRRHAQDPADAAHLLDVLGLTDADPDTEVPMTRDVRDGDVWRTLTPYGATGRHRWIRIEHVPTDSGRRQVVAHAIDPTTGEKVGPRCRPELATVLRDYALVERHDPNGQCARCGGPAPGAVAARVDVCDACSRDLASEESA